jgi:hypothetical protein
VIQVAMSDKHAVQSFEAQTRLQDLALSALSTINQEAEFIMYDHLAGKPTMDGWGGSGCA